MPHKFVLRQLFDIRPLKEGGDLDIEKITGIKEILNFRPMPDIECAENDLISRDDILIELAAIDEREIRLKNILSYTADPIKNGQRVYIKNKSDPRRRVVAINKKTPISNDFDFKNYFAGVLDSSADLRKKEKDSNFEKKAEQFFEQPLKNKTPKEYLPFDTFLVSKKNKRSIFPTLFVSLLLIVNIFLAKDFILTGFKQIKTGLSASLLISPFERSDEGGIFLLDNFSLIKSLVSDYDVIFKFLGFEREQKYLFIFQNNSEMRATGGFIGSYGILDIDKGKIKNFFVDDIYNIDGQSLIQIKPPAPLLKVADFWSTHDANWYADFPTSARKICWFYEKTGGPTVDGVISLTPTVIEKLLKITGPVELPDYNLTIDSDNFVEVLQFKIEKDFDKDLNQPKKILVDFASRFYKKLQTLPKDNWPDLINIFNQMTREKHIIFFFTDKKLEDFTIKENWAGELRQTSYDYLSVVNSNLGGNKTDLLIEEKIEHQAEVKTDGSVIDTVKIFRYHQGGKTKYEWWNTPNVDYLRIYVPLGAKLINDDGNTEVFDENGKTVFAKWVTTEPGKTSETDFAYILPSRVFNKYGILIQKQSGSLGSHYFEAVKSEKNNWQTEVVLNEDRYFETNI